jgi:hypothetical protein
VLAAQASCTTREPDPQGRPCSEWVPCGPGTTCNPQTGLCEHEQTDLGLFDAGLADGPAADTWDATAPSDSPAGEGNPDPLVGRGLVVRYFIDEAASGTVPKTLLDSAPSPLPLTIFYDAMSFDEVGGNRGLRWSAITQLGRVSAPIGGTKIQTELHGSKTGTIEVVVDVEATAKYGRICHIGYDILAGFFTLRINTPDTISFNYHSGNNPAGTWPLDHAAAGRQVMHLVYDSTRSVPEDRARLFLDGKLQTPLGGTNPVDPNDGLNMPASAHFVIGNAEVGDRGIQGTVFYMALYSEALTDAELSQNATALLASDDDL